MQNNAPLILIVDDEAHILHVLSLKLQNAGYRVITAEDGEEAFDSATRHGPDVVITDYQMPFLNGLELCIKLKQHPRTSTTPCLMLTARGYSLGQEQITQTNIAAVISKPFSPREILTRVRELTGGQDPACVQEHGLET
jgi:DNA-binding response OmpR family regulator